MVGAKSAMFIELLIQRIRSGWRSDNTSLPHPWSCSKVENTIPFTGAITENTDGGKDHRSEFVIGDATRYVSDILQYLARCIRECINSLLLAAMRDKVETTYRP